jgi:hypothetical protein
MKETSLGYFRRRMAEEVRLGHDSTEMSTGIAHRQLARMYRQRIEDLEAAVARSPILDPI